MLNSTRRPWKGSGCFWGCRLFDIFSFCAVTSVYVELKDPLLDLPADTPFLLPRREAVTNLICFFKSIYFTRNRERLCIFVTILVMFLCKSVYYIFSVIGMFMLMLPRQQLTACFCIQLLHVVIFNKNKNA